MRAQPRTVLPSCVAPPAMRTPGLQTSSCGVPASLRSAPHHCAGCQKPSGALAQLQGFLRNPAWGRRRALAPAEVSAEVLRHLVARAEAYLEGGVDGAVIAVPAHFDAAQRAATMEAGRLAGLASVQLLQGAPGHMEG